MGGFRKLMRPQQVGEKSQDSFLLSFQRPGYPLSPGEDPDSQVPGRHHHPVSGWTEKLFENDSWKQLSLIVVDSIPEAIRGNPPEHALQMMPVSQAWNMAKLSSYSEGYHNWGFLPFHFSTP